MQVRIVKDVPAGIKAGTIRKFPEWVALKLIDEGYAIEYALEKPIERTEIEPIEFKRKPVKARAKDRLNYNAGVSRQLF